MSRRQLLLGEEWSLVGRKRLLQSIEEAMNHGGGIVLCGPAGVGKTRVVREMLTSLESAGHDVEWVAATRAASAIPLGAVSHLLPDRARDLPAVLRRVSSRFAVEPGAPVTVIGVDDAHLLDDASAAVIHHLALRASAFLLITVRYGERCPDAVTALWKEGLARRVELPGLAGSAIGGLLDQTFGAALDLVGRQRLSRVSAGNPLLLRETLRAGLDTGALRYRHGVWRWDGSVRPTTRLVEVVTTRLGAVDRAVARVLELVAYGESLPALVLERLCGTESVAAAEQQGLLVLESSGLRTFARLSHPLYGEVIRSTMPWSRKRTLAGELAAAISTTPMRRRDDALRVGVWRLRAGGAGDPEVLLTAAKQALRRFDVELAARLARAASESGGGWPAEQALAQILSNCGWYEESGRTLPDAPADKAARTRWAVVRADVLYWGLGRVSDAEYALAGAGTAPGRRVAEGFRSLILLFDSRIEEAARFGAGVLARRDAEPQAVVWAAIGASAAAGITGDHERAAVARERGLAAAHPETLPWGRIEVECGYCMALLAMGRVEEAWAVSEREYLAAVRAESPEPLGVWAGFHGVVAKARGDLTTAAQLLRESLLLLNNYDTFRLAAPCLSALAGARAQTGDANRAARMLARAAEPARRPSRLFLPWMALDRAWTQAASGDTTSAAATARAAANQARDLNQPTVEAWARYDAARLGDARTVRTRLAELADTGPAAAAFARAAAGLAGNDPVLLEQAATELMALGLRLHAAEIATVAGRLFRRDGLLGRGGIMAERAAKLLLLCPNARTPLLAKGVPHSQLTRRERDVVALAATGQPSKQIAAHLGLSARTVDNHLGHAYAKLGVRDRAELAAVLERPDGWPD